MEFFIDLEDRLGLRFVRSASGNRLVFVGKGNFGGIVNSFFGNAD